MPSQKKTRCGPKGIPPEKHNEIIGLIKADLPVREIVDRTGVKKTKVYEIARNPIPMLVPPEAP